MNLLSENIKVSDCLDYANGSATRNGTTLDMQGYDGVVVIVKFAAIAAGAVGDIHWESGAASDMSDAADLTGTAIAVANDDDDQIFMSDLFRPAERYVRCVVTKDAANNMAESAVYIQYGAKDGLAITNTVTDEVTAEAHVSPAEGTK